MQLSFCTVSSLVSCATKRMIRAETLQIAQCIRRHDSVGELVIMKRPHWCTEADLLGEVYKRMLHAPYVLRRSRVMFRYITSRNAGNFDLVNAGLAKLEHMGVSVVSVRQGPRWHRSSPRKSRDVLGSRGWLVCINQRMAAERQNNPCLAWISHMQD